MMAMQSLEILNNRVRKVVPEPDSRVLHVGIRDGQRSQYLEVTIDLHGLNRYKALAVVNNTISVFYGVQFMLTVVHGMHRGTVLRDTLRTTLNNPRIESSYIDGMNPGVSHLWVSSGGYKINWMTA